MSNKLFFLTADDEICYTEEHYQDIMEQEELTEIEVYKAEPMKEKGIFWCSEHSFCGDNSSDTCGKLNCDEYEPRNGKNGCCKFYSTSLYSHGDKIILKFKPKNELKYKRSACS